MVGRQAGEKRKGRNEINAGLIELSYLPEAKHINSDQKHIGPRYGRTFDYKNKLSFYSKIMPVLTTPSENFSTEKTGQGVLESVHQREPS